MDGTHDATSVTFSHRLAANYQILPLIFHFALMSLVFVKFPRRRTEWPEHPALKLTIVRTLHFNVTFELCSFLHLMSLAVRSGSLTVRRVQAVFKHVEQMDSVSHLSAAVASSPCATRRVVMTTESSYREPSIARSALTTDWTARPTHPLTPLVLHMRVGAASR